MPINNAAILFPGQGSQVVGMGKALCDSIPIAAKTFREADQILGFSLSNLCWEGPTEELNNTINTQPALLTHSIAIFRAIQEKIPSYNPRYTAGHSVGEYAALVAAEALDFGDALRLVRERGSLMHAAGVTIPGGMAAVLGLALEDVESICGQILAENAGAVWVANDNCPGQVVIAGENKGIDEASVRLTEAGARKVVRLAVSIPAHTPLMQPAQNEFKEILERTAIRSPQVQVIGNVEANTLKTADEIREDLSAQLISRVRWTESMRTLLSMGATHFYELGPGKVLTGLMRRIERSVPVRSLDIPESLVELEASSQQGFL